MHRSKKVTLMTDKKDYFIHASSEIDPSSVIEAGCQVWNWTKVRENTKIGSGTKIGQCCYIDLDVSIGKNCKIQNSVQVYKGVTIGNDVFIGPNVTFTNDKYPRAFNNDWEIVSTTVQDSVSIGAGAIIVCGISVGKYAMIAAGSVVTKDVPDYGMVMGNPAKLVGFVDESGNLVKKIA